MLGLGDNNMTTATIDAQIHARWIALWLAVCAVTILGMILLGGVTRVTPPSRIMPNIVTAQTASQSAIQRA